MLIIPPFDPIEKVRAASPEERQRMFDAWNARFRRLNPGCFHADGTPKTVAEVLVPALALVVSVAVVAFIVATFIVAVSL
jgi:hypothetical protein